MQHVILFDTQEIRDNLLPLTYLRPIGELRVGIYKICQKWQFFLPGKYSYLTQEYLTDKYPASTEALNDAQTLYIAANIFPNSELVDEIVSLPSGFSLTDDEGTLIAYRGFQSDKTRRFSYKIEKLTWLYDLFLKNSDQIKADFEWTVNGMKSRLPESSITVIGDISNLFIHPEASDIQGCIINVTKGPVFIDRSAEVMEGTCLRGPIAICEGSVVNMGSKIYGGTTVGPYSKVGGELNNVVIQSYSNKAHDGFLGNAVIGEWCNIGAGCNASNLKNDYSEIKLWNYRAQRFLRTGLQFCGLIMGDHSKAGINTMLNTATVLGVGVNIHGSGFPRPFLASFTEGSPAGNHQIS